MGRIQNHMLDMVPSRLVTTGKNKPPCIWINHSIKSLSQRKQRLYSRVCQSGLSGDWSLYRLAKKQSQQQCRKAYNEFVCNLADAKGGLVSKKLWSFIKNQKNDYSGVAPLQDEGVTYEDAQSKAEILNKAFCS